MGSESDICERARRGNDPGQTHRLWKVKLIGHSAGWKMQLQKRTVRAPQISSTLHVENAIHDSEGASCRRK